MAHIVHTLERRFRYWLFGLPVATQRHKRPDKGIPSQRLWVSIIVHRLSLSSRIRDASLMTKWLQDVTERYFHVIPRYCKPSQQNVC
jgi:hypothetical protein